MAKKKNHSNVPAFPQLQGLGLNAQQQKFVMAYCRPDMAFNSTRAYIEAYGLDAIEDYVTAGVNASRLLKNAKVQAAIAVEFARILKNHDELAKRVLAEWAKSAFVDVTEFLSVSGPFVHLKSMDEIPAQFRPAIKSIENTMNGIKVTFHDKTKSLENIARCLGMFQDTIKSVDESYEGIVQRLAKKE